MFAPASCFFGCSKDKIQADNLTGCPENTSCAYLYADNRALDSMRVQNGNTRVFRYNQTFTSITASMRDLLFSVPMSDNRFEIGNAEITSGRVVYRHICPACNTIDLKPAGGIIKGQKADGNRWLIDATVYLKADLPGQAVSDTLHIKQYFIPGEVN